MSLSEAKNNLWVEKWRPKTLSDCTLPDRIIEPIKKMVKKSNIQNLLFFGRPGNSKTTLARCICNDLNAESLYIDASSDSGKSMIQNNVVPFASTVSIENKDAPKIAILDECLEENETVAVGTVDNYSNVPLKDLPTDKSFPVVSINMNTGELENDRASLTVDKMDEVYEITLENGKKIFANGKHPFIFKENGKLVKIRVEDGIISKEMVLI